MGTLGRGCVPSPAPDPASTPEGAHVPARADVGSLGSHRPGSLKSETDAFHPTNIGGCMSSSGHGCLCARASGSCRAPWEQAGCQHQDCQRPHCWGHTTAPTEEGHKLDQGRSPRCPAASGRVNCRPTMGRGHFDSRQGTPEWARAPASRPGGAHPQGDSSGAAVPRLAEQSQALPLTALLLTGLNSTSKAGDRRVPVSIPAPSAPALPHSGCSQREALQGKSRHTKARWR